MPLIFQVHHHSTPLPPIAPSPALPSLFHSEPQILYSFLFPIKMVNERTGARLACPRYTP